MRDITVRAIPFFLVGEVYLIYIVLFIGAFIYPIEYLESLSLVLRYIYLISVYLCIAALLFLDQGDLADYHLDRLSIVFLVVGSIFRNFKGIPNEWNYIFLVWTAGTLLLVAAITKWKSIPTTRYSWVAIGIIMGFSLLLFVVPIEGLQPTAYLEIDLSKVNVFVMTVHQIVYNISFVAPMEEIVFRGFLWGALKRMGWRMEAIVVAQGALFWFAHVARLGTPLTFFVTIPLMTLIFSVLVYYSKQLSPSILVHLIVNSLVPTIVAFLIAS